MNNITMNNNCQEYDYRMESLLLSCNKPVHFCSKNTHIKFLLSNFQNNIIKYICLSRIIFQDADGKTLIFSFDFTL